MCCQTYLVLAIHSITTAKPSAAHGTIVAPAGTPLPVRAVACHVAGIAADAADDVGSEVLPLGTVVLAVSDLPAVLASLVLIVTQRAVQGSKLAELVPLQFVLTLGDRGSLWYFRQREAG